MPDTPEPLVPADVDLRGLDYMPLFGNHLFGSRFNSTLDDSAWRAGVTLWWAAWNQQPAGSLPNDDPSLAQLSGIGREGMKTWRRVKEAALHGFVLCSDGRLYHPFLCKQVLVAWDKRMKERHRKANWRANKAGKSDGQAAGSHADVPRDIAGTGRGRNSAVPEMSPLTGRDGTYKEKERARQDITTVGAWESPRAAPLSNPDPPSEPVPVAPTRRGAVAVLLRQRGVTCTGSHPVVVAWAQSGVTDEQLREAVDVARMRKPEPEPLPIAYLAPIVAEITAKPVDAGGSRERDWSRIWPDEAGAVSA